MDLGYLQVEVASKLLEKSAEVGRVLNGLLASVTKQSGL